MYKLLIMNSKVNVINQGFLLKRVRGELELSAKAFAKPLDYSDGHWYSFEKRAKIKKEIIEKVAKVYNVNIKYLQTGEGQMFQSDENEVQGDTPKLSEIEKLLLEESKKQTGLMERQTELMEVLVKNLQE